MTIFRQASAVWCRSACNTVNQFAGFYTVVEAKQNDPLLFKIAARSYYRLYVNGNIVSHGPARTARGYCRVDEITYVPAETGILNIAIEVIAYDKPGKYCNDCTLEPGMLCAEISCKSGTVLAATGRPGWKCIALKERRSDVETMSHSRGIIEYYDLKADSFVWRNGSSDRFEEPISCDGQVLYLPRRSPMADLMPIRLGSLVSIKDMAAAEHDAEPGYVMKLARMFNPDWYASIPAENCFQLALRNEQETNFSGTCKRSRRTPDSGNLCAYDTIEIVPGNAPSCILWALPVSELGFIEVDVTVENTCIIDLINSDHRDLSGSVRANTYITRYTLEPGSYHLTTFEPKLVRYLKVILRTDGKALIRTPSLLRYTCPDYDTAYFECSDGDLNRIYEGAARTLRLNTLDIFMDCPQRERGGWLCDSNFTARGAWQLYGNAGVEHDFIENFMLTDGSKMWKGFFPEVYPASKTTEGDTGFQSWSFWLAHEVFEYYLRTGDKESVEAWRERISLFISGILSLKGESGLIEGLDNLFVDWSMSNRSYALLPISVPVNCLISMILDEMGELYERDDWKQESLSLRTILEQMDEDPGIFGGGGDAAEYKDGRLSRLDCATETGAALELYSGYHLKDRNYLRRFIYTMGYSPAFRPNPNIGKSNLFIGLMIRFSVLEKLGRIRELVRELKDLYLPELKDGSGTFFENYNGMSGCHGFNGAAAAMLLNRVLGLGEPRLSDHTIEISPAPGKLLWACGNTKCNDDEFYMSWQADPDEYTLDISLDLPDGWTPVFRLPDELKGYAVSINGCRL